MAHKNGFTLEGGKELERLLKDFPFKMQEKILDASVRAGASVVRKEARKNLRQNKSIVTGNLYNSIKIEKTKGIHGIFKIFTSRRGPHAHLVEYGTGPRRLKEPHYMKLGGHWVWVEHTGSVPAKPFFRPAMDEHHRDILKAIMFRMAKRMAKEAEKMAGSYRTLSKSYRKRIAA